MKIRVWDLPTRLFHWGTAACFVGLVVSGEVAGEAMVWHFRLGYLLLALVLFRILWGVLGGHWSRFTSFVRGPSEIWRYVRGIESTGVTAGHNPLGSLSVLAILFFSLLQVTAGLMSDDEVFTSGPLAAKVPAAWVQMATFFHTQIGKLVLIGLVVLHLGAIAWYRFRKGQDLVRPMLAGDKELPPGTRESRDDLASRGLALVLLALCAAAVAGLLRWAQASF